MFLLSLLSIAGFVLSSLAWPTTDQPLVQGYDPTTYPSNEEWQHNTNGSPESTNYPNPGQWNTQYPNTDYPGNGVGYTQDHTDGSNKATTRVYPYPWGTPGYPNTEEGEGYTGGSNKATTRVYPWGTPGYPNTEEGEGYTGRSNKATTRVYPWGTPGNKATTRVYPWGTPGNKATTRVYPNTWVTTDFSPYGTDLNVLEKYARASAVRMEFEKLFSVNKYFQLNRLFSRDCRTNPNFALYPFEESTKCRDMHFYWNFEPFSFIQFTRRGPDPLVAASIGFVYEEGDFAVYSARNELKLNGTYVIQYRETPINSNKFLIVAFELRKTGVPTGFYEHSTP